MDRREIVKHLTALSFTGRMFPFDAVLNEFSGPINFEPNIYQSIGVEPIINCVGTYTIIGGSIERPEVIQAMHDASGAFIQYDEMAFGIGQRLANLTGAEWGIITSGCAAALKHVTAGCVSGGNPEKLIRIPDLTGIEKSEVIMRSRTAYDHGIRNIGVKLIPANNIAEVRKAINPRTAMIFIMAGNSDLPEIAELARPMNIPVLVDAAAEDLTIPNIHLQHGASVVAYSGGKALCGPQCAGLAIGKKDILMSSWQASSPHHGPGRDNKVGKEEMIGMLAAVEAWVKRDHVEKMNIWRTYLNFISQRVSSIKRINCTIEEPKGLSNHSPSLRISWNSDELNIDGPEVAYILSTEQPRIAVHTNATNDLGVTSIVISSGQMQPGNDKVVAERINKILSKPYQKPKEMIPPKFNISGRWHVEIEFYNSNSIHTFFIEQETNWLAGTHRGEFLTNDLVGVLEGDQIKINVIYNPPADMIPFRFFGRVVSPDYMTGQIYMGQYLDAKFTASRYIQNLSHKPVRVLKQMLPY